MCFGTFSLVRTLNIFIYVEVAERAWDSLWLLWMYIVLLYTHSRSYLELETTVMICRITLYHGRCEISRKSIFVDRQSLTFRMIKFCGSSSSVKIRHLKNFQLAIQYPTKSFVQYAVADPEIFRGVPDHIMKKTSTNYSYIFTE